MLSRRGVHARDSTGEQDPTTALHRASDRVGRLRCARAGASERDRARHPAVVFLLADAAREVAGTARGTLRRAAAGEFKARSAATRPLRADRPSPERFGVTLRAPTSRRLRLASTAPLTSSPSTQQGIGVYRVAPMALLWHARWRRGGGPAPGARRARRVAALRPRRRAAHGDVVDAAAAAAAAGAPAGHAAGHGCAAQVPDVGVEA
eukprot:365778-Chlamydomonas_euryale.AAC.15